MSPDSPVRDLPVEVLDEISTHTTTRACLVILMSTMRLADALKAGQVEGTLWFAQILFPDLSPAQALLAAEEKLVSIADAFTPSFGPDQPGPVAAAVLRWLAEARAELADTELDELDRNALQIRIGSAQLWLWRPLPATLPESLLPLLDPVARAVVMESRRR